MRLRHPRQHAETRAEAELARLRANADARRRRVYDRELEKWVNDESDEGPGPEWPALDDDLLGEADTDA